MEGPWQPVRPRLACATSARISRRTRKSTRSRRDDNPEVLALRSSNFFKVLTETPLDQLEAALTPMLNVDGALRFLALEIALVNTDGYWTRASDYNIYLDEQGEIHVLPHDVNEAFEEEGLGAGRGRGGHLRRERSRRRRRRGAPRLRHPAAGPRDCRRFRPTFGRATVESGPAHRPRRCDEAAAIAAARGARPARPLSGVRAGNRPESGWTGIRSSRSVRQYQASIAKEVKADTRKLLSWERFQTDVAEGPRVSRASSIAAKRFC